MKDFTDTPNREIVISPIAMKAPKVAQVPAGISVNEIVTFLHPGADVIVEIDGVPIHKDDWHIVPSVESHVLIFAPVYGGEGKNPLRIILSIVVVVVAAIFTGPYGGALAGKLGVGVGVGRAIVGTAIMTAGMMLVDAIAPVKMLDSGSSSYDDSPTYSLSGGSNRANPWGSVPVNLGFGRVYPPFGAKSYTEIVGNDEYLRMFFIWGYGPQSIEDIKIGDTLITSYEDVEIETREGWSTDEAVTLFPSQVDQVAVNVILTVADGMVIRTATPNVDELAVDVVFPTGLVGFASDGDHLERYVEIDIEYREVGAGSWTSVPLTRGLSVVGTTIAAEDFPSGTGTFSVYASNPGATITVLNGSSAVSGSYIIGNFDYTAGVLSAVTDLSPAGCTGLVVSDSSVFIWDAYSYQISITGGTAGTVAANYHEFRDKTTSAVRRGFNWPVDNTKEYEIGLTRVTADATEDTIVDEVYWANLKSITADNPIEFPHPLAVTAMRIKATDQLQNTVDTVNAIVKSYAPIWDDTGEEWGVGEASYVKTNNPAALLRWVLMHNGNARARTAGQIDDSELGTWYEFCVENTYAYNMYRDYKTSVWEACEDICVAGRASPTINDGLWAAMADTGEQTLVQHITPRNSWGFSSEKTLYTPPHAFRIRFINEDNDYLWDERIVYDDDYTSANATLFEALEFPGVTDPELIWKFGRFHMAQAQLRPETYSVYMDFEHLVCRRGSKIRVSHDIPMWGSAWGRVKSLTIDEGNITHITLDETVTMETGVSYACRFRLATGSTLVISITLDIGDTAILELATPVATALGPAVGDLAMFGVSGSETTELLVHSITRASEYTAQIFMVDVSPAIYTADTGEIPAFDPNITASAVNNTPPDTPVIIGTESGEAALETQQGAITYRILVYLAPPTGEVRVAYNQVRYRLEDEIAWNYAPSTESSTIPITPVINLEDYEVQAQAVSIYGIPSAWTDTTEVAVTGNITDFLHLGTIDFTAEGLAGYDGIGLSRYALYGIASGTAKFLLVANDFDYPDTWGECFGGDFRVGEDVSATGIADTTKTSFVFDSTDSTMVLNNASLIFRDSTHFVGINATGISGGISSGAFTFHLSNVASTPSGWTNALVKGEFRIGSDVRALATTDFRFLPGVGNGLSLDGNLSIGTDGYIRIGGTGIQNTGYVSENAIAFYGATSGVVNILMGTGGLTGHPWLPSSSLRIGDNVQGTGAAVPTTAQSPNLFSYDVTNGLVVRIAGKDLAFEGNLDTVLYQDQDISAARWVFHDGYDPAGYAGIEDHVVPSYEAMLAADIYSTSSFVGNYTTLTVALATTIVNESFEGMWFTVDENGGETYFISTGFPTLSTHVTKILAGSGTDVTLNASATIGGLSLSGQEISNRAATNALTGYATAAQITAIEDNTGKAANVPTALSVGTVGANTVAITSDGGTDDITLPAATVSTAGMLTTTKWAEIIANTSASHAESHAIASHSDTAVTGAELTSDHTKLGLIEALADVTDATNVTAAGALMDSEVAVNIKTLVLPASTTISTVGATLIDDTTAANARTTLGVDAAGTGNAATATTLATSRTIGGVSFDGSANIDLPGVNTAGTQNTTGNAATATNLTPAGTSDQVLTSNGAGTAPTFQDVSGITQLYDDETPVLYDDLDVNTKNILDIGYLEGSSNQIYLKDSGNAMGSPNLYWYGYEGYGGANAEIATGFELNRIADTSGHNGVRGFETAAFIGLQDPDTTAYTYDDERNISNALTVSNESTAATTYKDIHGIQVYAIANNAGGTWAKYRGAMAIGANSIQTGLGVCGAELWSTNPASGSAASGLYGLHVGVHNLKAAHGTGHDVHGIQILNYGYNSGAGLSIVSNSHADTGAEDGSYSYAIDLSNAISDTAGIRMPDDTAGGRIMYDSAMPGGSYTQYSQTLDAFQFVIGGVSVLTLDATGTLDLQGNALAGLTNIYGTGLALESTTGNLDLVSAANAVLYSSATGHVLLGRSFSGGSVWPIRVDETDNTTNFAAETYIDIGESITPKIYLQPTTTGNIYIGKAISNTADTYFYTNYVRMNSSFTDYILIGDSACSLGFFGSSGAVKQTIDFNTGIFWSGVTSEAGNRNDINQLAAIIDEMAQKMENTTLVNFTPYSED